MTNAADTRVGAMTCPKCAGSMVTYQRSAIIVEQCRDCRGIFLDRGELERIVEAEGGAWLGPAESRQRDDAPRPAHGSDPDGVDRGHEPRPDDANQKLSTRRRSFFGELLEGPRD